MATWYIDPQGPAGSGTSPTDSRTTIPAYAAGDILLFKRGSTYSFTNQLSITLAGCKFGNYGDAAVARPVWTSTATNFGSINVQTQTGETWFDGIEFRNYLSGSTNGSVINCSVNVTSGRAASLKCTSCKWQTTAYSAVRLNGTNQAEAALSCVLLDCEWDDIGEDCIFGWAVYMEIGRPNATRISTRTLTGDFLGMINGYESTVHMYGPGLVDHSDVDIKQCFIVDASGGTEAGLVTIEDLTFIGYGSASVAPTAFVVGICDLPFLFRRNLVYTYGLTAGVKFAADEISNNIFLIGNADANNVCIAISGAGGKVYSNTFVGVNALPSTLKTVTMANGVPAASAFVQNNQFVNLPIAIKSDSVGGNPTATYNNFWNVTSPRLNSSGVAFAGGNDRNADPEFRADYMPMGTDVLATGLAVTTTDFYGVTRGTPPTIGAVQYGDTNTLLHHLGETGMAIERPRPRGPREYAQSR